MENTFSIFIEKQIVYKYTHAVQTCVIKGSAVYIIQHINWNIGDTHQILAAIIIITGGWVPAVYTQSKVK